MQFQAPAAEDKIAKVHKIDQLILLYESAIN